MQAERKEQELESNALVQGLSSTYEGLKQGPSRGTMIGLAVLLAGVLLAVLFYYFYTSSTAADSGRWLALDSAVFPDQLSTLLEDKDFKDTPQARIARYKEARMKLAAGVRDLGHGSSQLREAARKNIESAIELYEDLAKGSSRVPQLHQEALWGAAKGKESLGGSDNVAAAIKLYETLTKEYDSSALGKDAKKQLDRLNSPATKQTLSELRSLERP